MLLLLLLLALLFGIGKMSAVDAFAVAVVVIALLAQIYLVVSAVVEIVRIRANKVVSTIFCLVSIGVAEILFLIDGRLDLISCSW